MKKQISSSTIQSQNITLGQQIKPQLFAFSGQLEEKEPKWERSFFMPCDSHGIQHLVKQILELNWFSTILKQA